MIILCKYRYTRCIITAKIYLGDTLYTPKIDIVCLLFKVDNDDGPCPN